MIDKKSFLVFYDILATVKELTDEQAGKLFRAMLLYEIEGIEPDFTGTLKFAWIPIKQDMDRNNKKYDEISKIRAEAGKIGGIASGISRRNKANEANASNAKKGNEAKSADLPEKTKQTKQTKQMLEPTQASNTNASEPLPDEANEANEHDNVNVNVNVNDNDIDIDGDRRASYGALRNVRLTADQYRKITSTYRNAGELIDKVSRWLPKAKRPQQDHYKLIHRFAKNDDWPKKPQRKSAPKYVDPPMEEPDVITWDAPDPLPERKAGETARDWIARGKQEKNIARVPEQYREKVRRFYENGEVVLPDRVKGQKLPVWILAAFGVEQPEKIDLLHDEAWKPVIDDWLMSETGKVEFTSGEISRLCSWYNSTGFRQDLPPLEDGQPIFKWIHNCRNSA